ncbi:MAG: YggS family pyridoxal phosphate-dependent enzyme [Candidatus Izemoplasma sp.]
MKKNVDLVKEQIKDYQDVHIVAATKYIDAAKMRELYNAGITEFGENRVEAFLEKKAALSDLAITWHIIGTLQTKKAKKVVNEIDYLHSLDNMKLALELNKRRIKPLKCFIQVNISNEDSKHGLNPSEVTDFVKSLQELDKIEVIGLMGMAELSLDEDIVSAQYFKLNVLQQNIKKELNIDLKELSIGMSNDYLIALKHNATYLRLGSILFRSEVFT